MKYRIHALPIWEKGHFRENQEDSIFPYPGMVSDDDRLFMVCDGMGGHESGEIASNAVIEAMSKRILSDSTPDGPFTDEILIQALSDAYDLLDQRDPNPESIKRMGTTMTLLKLHANGATLAHIGDSRIYQFRTMDGTTTVVFKSVDHSLVNDLVKVGELTPEEAKESPLKNRLTRAMQSHLESRPKAEISHITDIQPGDYFFLCSDGMLENADDDNLCFMVGRNVSDEEKVNMLKGNSEDNHDNHSAILIHILQVDGAPETAPAIASEESESNPEVSKTPSVAVEQPSTPIQRPLPPGPFDRLLKIIILCLLAVCAWMAYRFLNKPEIPTPSNTEVIENPHDMQPLEPIQPPSPAPAKPSKPTKPSKPATAKPEDQSSTQPGQEATSTSQQAQVPNLQQETKPEGQQEAEATSDQNQIEEAVNKK